MKEYEKLALAFARKLREWLTEEEMAEVIARNRSQRLRSICHSHDFCDANQAMLDAFAERYERDMEFSDIELSLCRNAWEFAKSINFDTEIPLDYSI